MPKHRFGEMLAEFRSVAGFSQARLAAEVGIHQSHLSRIERGIAAPPKLPTVLRLAKVLMLDEPSVLDLIAAASINEVAPWSGTSVGSKLPGFASVGPVDKKGGSRLQHNKAIGPKHLAGVLTSESVTSLVDTLSDSEIPAKVRCDIDKQVAAFVQWLWKRSKARGQRKS